MTKLRFKAFEFKKLSDPCNKESGHVKYVCYVQANTIPSEITDWMETNPREQKMTTNVALKIKDSLENSLIFHELNRGVVFSVEDAKWDNETKDLVLTLENPDVHGNIDGGHTLRAILDAKIRNVLPNNRFVFFEIFVGLDSPVELAAARNTSVQVDLKSIAELENSFEVIKDAFKDLPFSHRIQYKMNEHYNDEHIIPLDVREILAITLMFSQVVYPNITSRGTLSETQPVQCYSGKEATLRKFLNIANNPSRNKQEREQMIKNMSPLIMDIFKLWERIETNFATVSSEAGKRYGSRKYSKYDNGNTVGKSLFEEQPLKYIVPRGILYPLVGAFRALIEINDDGSYYWKKNPIDVWNSIGAKLVTILLDERSDNPDVLAKNTNLWSNLFKEVYIYSFLS